VLYRRACWLVALGCTESLIDDPADDSAMGPISFELIPSVCTHRWYEPVVQFRVLRQIESAARSTPRLRHFVLGVLLGSGCDMDTMQRAKSMGQLSERAKTMLEACGGDGTEADCAVATGDPEQVERVRRDLAELEAKHGKLEKVEMEVWMPPEPAEDKPGLTIGLAFYGGQQYRFNAHWVEVVNGDLALRNWRIQEKP
jgi:hypothetical protein